MSNNALLANQRLNVKNPVNTTWQEWLRQAVWLWGPCFLLPLLLHVSWRERKGASARGCLQDRDVVGMGLLQEDSSSLTLISAKGKSMFWWLISLTCRGWDGWLCYTNCHLNYFLPATTWMTTFSARLTSQLPSPTLVLLVVDLSADEYETGTSVCCSNKPIRNSVYSLTSVLWGES